MIDTVISPRFLVWFPLSLAQECPFPRDWGNAKNFSNDAHDPGGETMCGITQSEYDTWRKARNWPIESVRDISSGEGQIIYLGYWNPHSPALADGLDVQFADTALNEGTFAAIKILQDAVHAQIDGMWGPKTELALGAAELVATVQRFTLCRAAAYKRLRGFEYFGMGWERRNSEIGASALEMAKRVTGNIGCMRVAVPSAKATTSAIAATPATHPPPPPHAATFAELLEQLARDL